MNQWIRKKKSTQGGEKYTPCNLKIKLTIARNWRWRRKKLNATNAARVWDRHPINMANFWTDNVTPTKSTVWNISIVSIRCLESAKYPILYSYINIACVVIFSVFLTYSIYIYIHTNKIIISLGYASRI